MILTREQINRYMRHIIMPEISGPGQKKLLESRVYIYGENVEGISPLLYYLAAAGIGRVSCYFENCDGYEELFSNIRDLNNDVSIDIIEKQSPMFEENRLKASNPENYFRIFLGSFNFINNCTSLLTGNETEDEFIPTIIAIINQWKGTLQTFKNRDKLYTFLKKLSDRILGVCPNIDKTFNENFNAGTFSSSILGALCSIECVKLCLNLGETHKDLLYIDLLLLEFSSIDCNSTDFNLEKLIAYSDAHASSDDIKNKLSEGKVLIVGTGGLGAPAAFALAMAGVGTIGLVDYDVVEISNLNRQILHASSRIGMQKVESAKIFLMNINPKVNIITHSQSFNKDNAMEIIKDYDLIIDGVDNFPTRYLLNDACFFAKKPMIEAGVLRFNGLNTTIIPVEGHCYRCIQPNVPTGDKVPSCAESGVLGPVPGVMGFIQAVEAIKIIAGQGEILKNKLLFFDAQDLEFSLISLNKGTNCALCGEHPTINDLQEYEFVCESRNAN